MALLWALPASEEFVGVGFEGVVLEYMHFTPIIISSAFWLLIALWIEISRCLSHLVLQCFVFSLGAEDWGLDQRYNVILGCWHLHWNTLAVDYVLLGCHSDNLIIITQDILRTLNYKFFIIIVLSLTYLLILIHRLLMILWQTNVPVVCGSCCDRRPATRRVQLVFRLRLSLQRKLIFLNVVCFFCDHWLIVAPKASKIFLISFFFLTPIVRIDFRLPYFLVQKLLLLLSRSHIMINSNPIITLRFWIAIHIRADLDKGMVLRWHNYSSILFILQIR